MRRLIFVTLFWGVTFQLIAQDSLKTMHLSEVMIESESHDHLPKGNMTSLDEILEHTSSLSAIRRGSYAWDPVINGFSADRINVTIDGMHIYGACTDRMDPVTSYVETNNLKKLTVLKGSASSENGCAIGGGLDLKVEGPKHHHSEKLFGSIALGGQLNGLGGNFSTVFTQDLGNWRWRYAGSYRSYGNYADGDGNEVDFSQYNKTNHHISLNFGQEKNEFEISFILDEAWDVGYPALTMDVGEAKGRILSLSNKRKKMQGETWWTSWENKVYYNSIYHAMDDSKRPDVPIRMDMPGWSDVYGYYSTLKGDKGKHHWTAKFDFFYHYSRAEMTMYPPEEDGIEMFMLTWPDTYRANGGIYFNDYWKWNESSWSETKVRMDMVSTNMQSDMGRDQFETLNYTIDRPDYRSVWSLQETFGHSFSRSLELELGLGYVERLPSVTEMYGFYLYNRHDGYDYVGNPKIENETAWQFSAGMKWDYSIFNLQLNGFYYSMNNYILGVVNQDLMRMTVGAKGVKSYENVGMANQYGANFLLTALLNAHWSVSTDQQYWTGRLKSGDYLPLLLPYNSKNALKFQKNHFYVQGEYEFVGEQNQVSKMSEETPTDAYHLFHLRAGYQSGKFTSTLAVENLTNNTYNSASDWYTEIKRPGRNLSLQLTYNF